MREFLSQKSVGQFFDVSSTTVSRWIEDGVLPPPYEIGGVKRWSVAQLREAAAAALDHKAGRKHQLSDPDAILDRMPVYGEDKKAGQARSR